ncbi:hypothetical protein NDU88_004291 [Pleurodeles waltl]|uniref:Uncharacterized protein n=1 Tax=Pleurodeles waltl TaxID=8319 RepID=A0AAV7MY21_PLEWA|nr:hypothetical protein NDU88_004291 [Pleurodeles waltl]
MSCRGGAGTRGWLSGARHRFTHLSSAPDSAATPSNSGCLRHPAPAGPLSWKAKKGPAADPFTPGGAPCSPRGTRCPCRPLTGTGEISPPALGTCAVQRPGSHPRPPLTHLAHLGLRAPAAASPVSNISTTAPSTSGPVADPGRLYVAGKLPAMTVGGPLRPAAPLHLPAVPSSASPRLRSRALARARATPPSSHRMDRGRQTLTPLLPAGADSPDPSGLSRWVPGRAVLQDQMAGPVGATRLRVRHLSWSSHAR